MFVVNFHVHKNNSIQFTNTFTNTLSSDLRLNTHCIYINNFYSNIS